MNISDQYQQIIFPLSQDLKMKAQIESLRFEKTLYQLNIDYLTKKITEQEKYKVDNTSEDNICLCNLNIKEFEVKIMDYQVKMKLCDIKISREEFNLKNYKSV